METITAIQVQGISAETLLKRFDNLESQIKSLQQQSYRVGNKVRFKESEVFSALQQINHKQ